MLVFTVNREVDCKQRLPGIGAVRSIRISLGIFNLDL